MNAKENFALLCVMCCLSVMIGSWYIFNQIIQKYKTDNQELKSQIVYMEECIYTRDTIIINYQDHVKRMQMHGGNNNPSGKLTYAEKCGWSEYVPNWNKADLR